MGLDIIKYKITNNLDECDTMVRIEDLIYSSNNVKFLSSNMDKVIHICKDVTDWNLVFTDICKNSGFDNNTMCMNIKEVLKDKVIIKLDSLDSLDKNLTIEMSNEQLKSYLYKDEYFGIPLKEVEYIGSQSTLSDDCSKVFSDIKGIILNNTDIFIFSSTDLDKLRSVYIGNKKIHLSKDEVIYIH